MAELHGRVPMNAALANEYMLTRVRTTLAARPPRETRQARNTATGNQSGWDSTDSEGCETATNTSAATPRMRYKASSWPGLLRQIRGMLASFLSVGRNESNGAPHLRLSTASATFRRGLAIAV